MKKLMLSTITSALVMASGSAAAHCDADMAHCSHWHSSNGAIVKDGTASCLRTVKWNKEHPVEGCDFIPKKPEPKPEPVVAPVVAAPAPVVAPAPVMETKREEPKDEDQDGVVDTVDRCPGTPSILKVDRFGCTEMNMENAAFNLQVTFASGSASIANADAADLKKVADLMDLDKTSEVVIKGHTDSLGRAAFNQQLSQRRAEAVRDALVSNYGVDPERISAVGMGEASPIADNRTAEGRAQNRRVEAAIKAEWAVPATR